MKRTLCFSSLGCPHLTIEGLCQLARRHALSTVEIRSLEGTADFALRLADQPDALRAARQLLDAYGIDVRVLGSSFCLTTHRHDRIDSLVREGRVADALSAPFVRIFGGGPDTEILSPDLIRTAARLYRDTVRRFAGEGIRAAVLVETHGGFTNSDHIRQFHDAGDHEVALLWDTHHTWKIGGESPATTHARIHPMVRHLHVKDSVSIAGGKNAHRYVPQGTGEFPLGELLGLFEPAPPAIAFSLEWEKMWHPELPPLDDALTAFQKMLS